MAEEVAGLAALHRARAAMELARPAEAERYARQALASLGPGGDAAGLLAQALLSQGKVAEARQASEDAIAAEPENEWFHRLRANALRRQGRRVEALAAVNEALRLAPDVGAGHYLRSIILEESGHRFDAKDSAERALELEPQEPAYLRQLGDVLLEIDPEQAVEHYRRSLALNPHQATTLNNLGVAYNKLRRPVDAAVAFKAAVLADPTLDVAKDNVRSTVGDYLRVGLGGLLFVLIIFRGAANAAVGKGSDPDVAFGVLALLVVAGVLLWASRRQSRMRELEAADPGLLRIYRQIKGDPRVRR